MLIKNIKRMLNKHETFLINAFVKEENLTFSDKLKIEKAFSTVNKVLHIQEEKKVF